MNGFRYNYVNMRFVLLAVVIALAVTGSGSADDNVRAVQEKLRDGGFYAGEMDGSYSSELSAALTRYQIRNGLPITGQLDTETSKELGAKPAVGPSTAATEQSSSETWRRLRKGKRQTSTSPLRSETTATEAQETSSPRSKKTSAVISGRPPEESTQATSPILSETATTASASSDTAVDTGSPAPEFSTERLRDYVAAFVLAGLDRNVGAETEFYADFVEYYDSGPISRENIREDLKRYDEQWPERHFWVAGAINVEPQSENRVRVTFPLGFKLRNSNKTLSGKVDKTLVLEPAGNDFQIVAVNEKKAK